jgi:hypothetical protein
VKQTVVNVPFQSDNNVHGLYHLTPVLQGIASSYPFGAPGRYSQK